ncbi:MAG: methyltransferase domain-containing protein [Rhizobiaceae bacterium]|nr:methyltransferase domain-containing protein [Rhizobiaceae bacterium]
MPTIDTSSHDILADRRADYAEMLFADGDFAAAAALMMDALERAPGWALGWFRLGEFHEAAGNMDQAVEAWQMVLRIDPDDRPGAELQLALAGVLPRLEKPPSAFVETLFDQYADRFDTSLVEKLGYRVPDLMMWAIAMVHPQQFKLARDLGCGTGLMGERLRDRADRLEGFDISGEMLRKARAKGVYDLLEKADLQNPPPFSVPADVVTAADVFMYLGALDGVFAAVAAMQEPDALFAFSVERHVGTEDFVLLPSRRFAHCQAYIERVLDKNGYAPLSMENHVIRMDRDAPIEGILTVARKL